MEIKNKVTIITGASEGIGLATARHLSKKGARIILAARSADKLKQIEAELDSSLAIPTDMRSQAEIKNLIDKTIKKFGQVDILINSAGQGYYGPFEDINIEKYKEVMALNLMGPILSMQEVVPHMREQGGGVIINLSSRLSKLYIQNVGAYASIKSALNTISLTAREELKKDNIIISMMYPTMTSTKFGLNAINPRNDERVTGASINSWGAKIDTPDQVAEKIAWLIETGEAEASME